MVIITDNSLGQSSFLSELFKQKAKSAFSITLKFESYLCNNV